MAKKETIWGRAPRELDRFNDPIGPEPDWVEIPGAIVVPRAADDYEKRGPIIIEGFMIVLPSRVRDAQGADVALNDRWEIRVRGEVHQVDGSLADYGRKIIFYVMRAS